MKGVLLGVLLINVGTPEGGAGGPTAKQVKSYLEQFLMDPLVVDLPYLLRWLLVHAVILPFRAAGSVAAYQKIWTQEGSPLRKHMMELSAKVQTLLGSEYRVLPAMRYGTPSIASAIASLLEAGASNLIVLPLYPQYAAATTQSAIEEVRAYSGKIPVQVIPEFFDSRLFIDAFVAHVSQALAGDQYDYLLFSFHGLPERHLSRAGHDCRGERCAEQLGNTNRRCYRAQCYATARVLAEKLGLVREQYSVSFQSRLSGSRWMGPHTEEVLASLPAQGERRIAVMCPSFVSDCLETLEEVGMRGRKTFIQAGGQEFKLFPSLNAGDAWAKAVAQMIATAIVSER